MLHTKGKGGGGGLDIETAIDVCNQLASHKSRCTKARNALPKSWHCVIKHEQI